MTLVPSDEEGLGKLTPQDFIGSALFEKTFEVINVVGLSGEIIPISPHAGQLG